MKYIILCTCTWCFLVHQLFSQGISVELSVVWEKQKMIGIDSLVPYSAYLHIVYRNNTSDSLYMMSVSGNCDEVPPVIGELYCGLDRAKKKTFNYMPWKKDTTENKYIVFIGSAPQYLSPYWDIYDEMNAHDSVVEMNIINDKIKYINDIFFQQKKCEYTNRQNLNNSEITEKHILTTLKNNFIFLAPGEVKTDRYNLLAFQLEGGIYSFSLDKYCLEDFVYANPNMDEKEKTWKYDKILLPKKVGVYNLFSSVIKSNEVKVEFLNHK